MNTKTIESITLERATGTLDSLETVVAVTLADADAALAGMAAEHPPVCTDKVDYVVLLSDGDTVEGTYHLEKHDNAPLADHVRGVLNLASGDWGPPAMRELAALADPAGTERAAARALLALNLF